MRAAALLGGCLTLLAVTAVVAAPAQAHPLGNFTVSHYAGLTLHPDRLDVLSVVDSAEIPTQQARPAIDVDDDGELSPQELADHARTECTEVLAATTAAVDGTPVELTVTASSESVLPGAASLVTLRLECTLSATVDLSSPAVLDFAQTHRTDRIGWREITATGDGVVLLEPTVPAGSVSDELRAYPADMLSDPLDVRSVSLRTEPGSTTAAGEEVGEAARDGRDPLSRLVAAGDARLEAYVGSRELTPVVGLLAVLLAALLGAGHAMLPGHGKTVMAAYLAGRRGRRRDAVLVGGTVTLTHTVGVLVLGLLLTVASSVAGEQVLRYLGVVSGLLVVVVGAVLLRDAWRERRGPFSTESAGSAVVSPERVSAGMPHADHLEHADHRDGSTHPDVLGQSHAGHSHDHEPGHGHSHAPGHSHGRGHSHGPGGFSRRSLIGIGVAGGLVPSPSALVVMLGAIALGRTVFGVLLVLAYGVGMAGVLTAVGLLLVHGRARLERLSPRGDLGARVATVRRLLPGLTAALVLLVGLGLVVRSLVA